MTCKELKEQLDAAIEPNYEFIDFIAFQKKSIKVQRKQTRPAGTEQPLIHFVGFMEEGKLILEI